MTQEQTDLDGAVSRLLDPEHVVPMETARLVDQRDLDAVLAVLGERGEALRWIASQRQTNAWDEVEAATTTGANQHSACQRDCEDCDGSGRIPPQTEKGS